MLIDIFDYLVYTSNLISRSKYGELFIMKGGTALISKMIENGRQDLYRLTSDLDIHCNKKELWEEFYTSIEGILNSNERGYKYSIIKRRSQFKELINSDSLVFKLVDTDKTIKFKIDMNIKSNSIITVDYSPILGMKIYDVYTMLADKIAAVSSKKIYRRAKDLYDILVLGSMNDINLRFLNKHLGLKHPDIVLENMLIEGNMKELEHAYMMFDGIKSKPDFRVLVRYCMDFLEPIYSKSKADLLWVSKEAVWVDQ